LDPLAPRRNSRVHGHDRGAADDGRQSVASTTSTSSTSSSSHATPSSAPSSKPESPALYIAATGAPQSSFAKRNACKTLPNLNLPVRELSAEFSLLLYTDTNYNASEFKPTISHLAKAYANASTVQKPQQQSRGIAGELTVPNHRPLGGTQGNPRAAHTASPRGSAKSRDFEVDKAYPRLPDSEEKAVIDPRTGKSPFVCDDRELQEMIERDILDRNLGVGFDDVAALGDAKRLLNEAVMLPLVGTYFLHKFCAYFSDF
jgi:hypothetical protein